MWNLVRSKKVAVRNAETFPSVCGSLKTNVIWAPVENINVKKPQLDIAWKSIETIKGTQKCHHVIARAPYTITCKLFPSHDEEIQVSMHPNPDNKEHESETGDDESETRDEEERLPMQVTEETVPTTKYAPPQTAAVIGSWVTVIYDMWVPGTIEQVYQNGKVLIKYKKSTGPNSFMWPEKSDNDIIDYNSVLTRIMIPHNLISYGRGGIYSLDASEFTQILDLFVGLM